MVCMSEIERVWRSVVRAQNIRSEMQETTPSVNSPDGHDVFAMKHICPEEAGKAFQIDDRPSPPAPRTNTTEKPAKGWLPMFPFELVDAENGWFSHLVKDGPF